jgi:hypothetical protein
MKIGNNIDLALGLRRGYMFRPGDLAAYCRCEQSEKIAPVQDHAFLA